MSEIQEKAESKISELLQLIHQSLSKHPSVEGETRDLQPAEEQLLRQLQGNQFLYSNWVTLLAIDSYASSIMAHAQLFEQLSGMMTSLLQNFKSVGQSLKSNEDRKKTIAAYGTAYETLLECIQINQQIMPRSDFIKDQNMLIENSTHEVGAQESIVGKLREQNIELRKKLEMNDKKLMNMEFKLTKLLKQHDESERASGYQVGSTMSYVELRQELAFKEQEIQRMNQQFSYQIQKYNTVYDAMKKQLEQMRGYQNIDLIEQIQLLETQIVRLRQERQRDQIIMRQLRSDNMMFSTNGYGSPRHSKRFTSSRFDY